MKLSHSMFSWFGYYMPFGERIDVIKEAGFDAAMISWEDECEPYPVERERFPEIVRKKGLDITNIHAPFMGYNAIWENTHLENQGLLKTFVGFVEDCHRFDIPTVVVHTSDIDLHPDYKMENGLAFFSELAEAGERLGVNIAVENVSRQYLLRFLLDAIDAEHFGMCYDSSHDFMLPCGRGKILGDYKHRIKALHLSDNDLYLDRHWIPGEGQIPFEIILPEILSVPVPAISFEVVASEAWQEKPPIDFCRAVRGSLERVERDVDGL